MVLQRTYPPPRLVLVTSSSIVIVTSLCDVSFVMSEQGGQYACNSNILLCSREHCCSGEDF